MRKHLNTKTLATSLIFALLAGCGGGGGDGASTGGTQSPTTGAGANSTPTTGSGANSTSTTGANTTTTTVSSSTTTTVAANNSGPHLASAMVVSDGTALGTAQWPDGSTATGGLGQEVGGLTCSSDSATYAYTQLIVLQDGKQLAVPANVGVGTPSLASQAQCVYPVHTRDRTGKIRVNSSSGATYTLGQFFSVWGQPLTSTNVAGIEGTPTIYLIDNGAVTPFTGDPATIELRANRHIVVMTGTPVTEIPNYSWQALPPLNSTPWILEGGQLGTLGVTTWSDGSTATGGNGAPVGNATCESNLTANFDIHTHLSIYRDGTQLALPQDIGRTSGANACEYQIHTHDRSGTIHTASTEYRRFTLGDFFAVWGQPLSSTNVAGFTGEPIEIFIEDKGDLRRFTGDPATIDLTSHRSIVIQIGTPVTPIPTYDWLNFGAF